MNYRHHNANGSILEYQGQFYWLSWESRAFRKAPKPMEAEEALDLICTFVECPCPKVTVPLFSGGAKPKPVWIEALQITEAALSKGAIEGDDAIVAILALTEIATFLSTRYEQSSETRMD